MERKTRVSSIIIAGAIALCATMCYTLHRSDRRAGIAELEDRDKVTISERSFRAGCIAVSSTHLLALGFSEVAMATKTCQHMIVMCEKTHLPCSRCKVCKSREHKDEKLMCMRNTSEGRILSEQQAALKKEVSSLDKRNACQYIEDGDPSYVSATNAVVTAGVATAEEIAAFLKQAIDN